MENVEIIPVTVETEEDRANKREYTTQYDWGRGRYTAKDAREANRPGRYDGAPRIQYHRTTQYVLDPHTPRYSPTQKMYGATPRTMRYRAA